jgi:deoxyribodipyrimidine photolyase-related protein
MASMDQSLIVILGDQLTLDISSLKLGDKTRDTILMAEVAEETTYARHHKKKLVFVLSAMRHFANLLRQLGWRIDYITLGDSQNTGSLTGEIERAKARHGITHVIMTEPSEWRVKQALLHVMQLEDSRFICSHAEFGTWAQTRKTLRMEYFYRDMRRRTGLLMDRDAPAGGAWNFDSENRKRAQAGLRIPKPPQFPVGSITQDVIDLVDRRFADNFGAATPFWFAVTHAQAEIALRHFLDHCLNHFGETQDAMLDGEAFLHHSVLSAYINIGLLDPLHVCRSVEERYRKGGVPLSAAEGFIRQIIGWREYIRGIYWLKMPAYVDLNVRQTRDEAYAHHIQRLMVTGNFALLAGIDPKQVHEWYLAVYIDAFEWVEMPNTIGMALHADGGLLGSKPYAASGNYINKMSNYCGSCTFDVKQRTGANACPFNALYWDFIARHMKRFAKNPRMAQICRGYEKFSDDEKNRIAARAAEILGKLVNNGIYTS